MPSPYDIIVAPNGATILPANNHATFTNEGAVALAAFVLPKAIPGLRYSFAVQNTNGIKITATQGATIRVGAAPPTVVNGSAASVALGSTLSLAAGSTADNNWVTTAVNGVWLPAPDEELISISGEFPIIQLPALTGSISLTLLKGHRIQSIDIQETNGAEITGGLHLYSDSLGDVFAAQPVGASEITFVRDADFVNRFFSMTDDTDLALKAVGSWNGASVNIQIVLVAISAPVEIV